jgi:hypothetical protein
MKKLANISPFLLLVLPLFLIMVTSLLLGNFNNHSDSIVAQKKATNTAFIQVSASPLK